MSRTCWFISRQVWGFLSHFRVFQPIWYTASNCFALSSRIWLLAGILKVAIAPSCCAHGVKNGHMRCMGDISVHDGGHCSKKFCICR